MRRLSAAKAPIVILAILVALDFFTWKNILPSKLVMFNTVADWLANGGLPFVFALSLIENVAFVNVYFPGSIAILAAMVGTEGDFERVLAVWSIISIGAVVGQSATFFAASQLIHTFSKVSKGQPLYKNKLGMWLRLGLSSFWHPHLASMACLSMAEASVPLRYFLLVSVVCTSLWNAFWAVFVLWFGNIFVDGYTGTILVYLYLVGWIIIRIVKLKQ